jgi:hypothetical protein
MFTKFGTILVAAMVLAGPTMAQSETEAIKPTGEEVSIAFATMGGIDDWRADGTKALYIKGRRSNEWYYARLLSSCHGLNFANTIGFDSEPSREFNRFSAILVDGQNCKLTSLIKSEKPEKKK